MFGKRSTNCNIILYLAIGIASSILLLISLNVNYQLALTREHIRFRSGFPSQVNWIKSPQGTLNCYLFNVTNSVAFLNGTDSKLKIVEVGPIVYRIKGKNKILDQMDSTLIYEKIRYDEIYFDAAASISPDILNKTVILPNFVLLGAAGKVHDWFILKKMFNVVTINEPVFLQETIHYFLWEFTTPTLNLLATYIPNIVANCGMLYNALKKRDEVYNVQIGTDSGIKHFFQVNSLNNKTYFSEQSSRRKYLKGASSEIYCPIEVVNAFDNSLFPPLISADQKFTIVAGESCRTLQLKYNDTVNHLGFSGYRYVLDEQTTTHHCLDNSMGVKLHKGMFDVSKCLFNDVPAAFSLPHFYGSSYNWSEHFEGLFPNKDKHETSIIIQPVAGIPLEEKYRFQSNIPMPDMTGYNGKLQRFSNMVLPTFWYEYDLDDLPSIVLFLMGMNVYFVPFAQPLLIICFAISSIYCYIFICLKINTQRRK